MAQDPFTGSQQRISRAKAHIRNLDRIFKAFMRRKPYKKVSESQRDGIHEIHKLKARRRTLPCSFSDVSTDAIENLRSALDHAAYAIAIAAKTDPKLLHQVYFPFGRTKVAFAKRIRKTCPGFPRKILALLCSFKPYQGGNDTLWALNEMANTSKHKTLTTVAFHIMAANALEIRGFGNFSLPPTWDRAQNELILGTTRRDTHATYNVSFQFRIGFECPPVIAGKPFIALLNDMASIVDRIVAGIEAEGRSIGLFS